MRKLLGIGAIVLGGVGVLLCATAIGIGWWVAVKTSAQVDRVATRLDCGMSEVDERLARVEARLNDIRTDIDEVRGAAEAIAEENPELPRVREQIEKLLDRLVPACDRVDSLADSLRMGATGLNTAGDIVDYFSDGPEAGAGARSAAEKIDLAANKLNGLRARIEDSKTLKAVQLTRQLVTLAGEAAAGSERLAEGLTDSREAIALLRERTEEWRDKLVFWIYMAATASTLIWLWGGLSQMCLIGWGRRSFAAGRG